jgi:hypothetical protein
MAIKIEIRSVTKDASPATFATHGFQYGWTAACRVLADLMEAAGAPDSAKITREVGDHPPPITVMFAEIEGGGAPS